MPKYTKHCIIAPYKGQVSDTCTCINNLLGGTDDHNYDDDDEDEDGKELIGRGEAKTMKN